MSRSLLRNNKKDRETSVFGEGVRVIHGVKNEEKNKKIQT
jgi:hypothetical protein